jgi:hypothetical protein
VHVADPVASVLVWHRGLPRAVNDTQAPRSGVPALLRVTLNTYCCPVADRAGAAAVNVVGVWPTESTVSTVLAWKS